MYKSCLRHAQEAGILLESTTRDLRKRKDLHDLYFKLGEPAPEMGVPREAPGAHLRTAFLLLKWLSQSVLRMNSDSHNKLTGGTHGQQVVPAPPPVLGLHHAAYRCRDAEETRHFYEDILGLPLVHVVTADHVSTGKSTPFAHVFFELADGSCIAFFDLGDNVTDEPSPNTPAWVNHIAFKVPSTEALRRDEGATGVATALKLSESPTMSSSIPSIFSIRMAYVSNSLRRLSATTK